MTLLKSASACIMVLFVLGSSGVVPFAEAQSLSRAFGRGPPDLPSPVDDLLDGGGDDFTLSTIEGELELQIECKLHNYPSETPQPMTCSNIIPNQALPIAGTLHGVSEDGFAYAWECAPVGGIHAACSSHATGVHWQECDARGRPTRGWATGNLRIGEGRLTVAPKPVTLGPLPPSAEELLAFLLGVVVNPSWHAEFEFDFGLTMVSPSTATVVSGQQHGNRADRATFFHGNSPKSSARSLAGGHGEALIVDPGALERFCWLPADVSVLLEIDHVEAG